MLLRTLASLGSKQMAWMGLLSVAALAGTGCVVHEHHPRERVVVVDRGPAPPPVEYVVVDEPPPVERVYIVERGYPPGCYYYGGFVFYQGRRYERNVFVNRVVNVNIQKNVYVNVTENRRVVENVKVQHRTEFQHTGGHHPNSVSTHQPNPAFHSPQPNQPAPRSNQPAPPPKKPKHNNDEKNR